MSNTPKPRAKPAPEKDVTAPEFAVGITSDNGLVLAWPQNEEVVYLSESEVAMIRRVLAATAPIQPFIVPPFAQPPFNDPAVAQGVVES